MFNKSDQKGIYCLVAVPDPVQQKKPQNSKPTGVREELRILLIIDWEMETCKFTFRYAGIPIYY